ncbi:MULTISPECIES: DUF3575 domain-containing protein [Parabacteroides]|jgi:hypothetical protein|uniref:DUF3575 domain-containing protein n=1 Tax=Parabacteroides faecis TaxID=1217282 RepID=A0ABR6KHK3_9BACT|nr:MULTISPECIES: DUF3575 domain-containing protein [Parabacteroides]MBB4620987.1 hypothetical protein [Parabacteroides faecis]MCS2892343.1 DUF3575 domain-containing protein [Parabacteroides faecis]RHR35938.1 DUF3575 domain-containing protein [Parabacteroides sp. AF18-52]UVQ49017.1 DUF3575 domain-containing protein [Parabacteroides faecis]
MRNVLLLILICYTSFVSAKEGIQTDRGPVVAIKTNIPYWATATFNAGVEFRLARKWTLELEAGLNPFSGKNDDGSYGKSLKHLRLHPELRYWFCESFYKSFIGIHVPYILYNVSDIKLLGTEGERHQGWGTGVGISYGYQWLLSKHWNLEATVGVGYLYLESDKYPCTNCGSKIEKVKKHYFGPTQAAVSFIYLF